MISVIIPAHNEGGVIARCLGALLQGAEAGELEIIVICNGCTDDTAVVARTFGEPVKVLEMQEASKSKALDLGDAHATSYPRFYIDADIRVDLQAIRRVAWVLASGRYLVAAPRMRVKLSERSWWVRAYYAIWTRLPYCSNGMIGSGIYALSREGRSRFGLFPNIISDDGFVRAHFSPEERVAVDGCFFHVTPPKSIWGLVKIKTRSQFGKYQLYAAYPELRGNDPRNYWPIFSQFVREPRTWPCLAVYALVLGIARLRSYWRLFGGRDSVWDRDDTSRCE